MDIGERIGLNLKRYMTAHSLTQGQVAAKAGVSQPVISDLVTGGTKDPPISTLLKICAGLQIGLESALLAELTPSDVDETESPSDRRVADLELRLAETNRRLALVLEQMPALLKVQRRRGKQEPPS